VEEIATVYARSLFEVAKEHDALDEVHEQLGQFADELSTNRELQVFFFSPYFSSPEKKDGIRKVIEGGNEYFVRFLELLAERHRLPVVFRIRREFDRLWAEENKLLPVTIRSAVELDESTVKDIGKKIEEQTGRKIELTSSVDPNLIGGLQMQVGNMVFDSTIRSRLEKLRREVAKAA
jgi:F-type H+-transporting ATPase subunit delta